MKTQQTKQRRKRRHRRVRGKVHGSANRPRLCVFRSSKGIYAQLIDDDAGVTLAAASTLEPGRRERHANPKRQPRSASSWRSAPRTPASTSVVFDRGGYLYHGRVKALADGAREGGLEF